MRLLAKYVEDKIKKLKVNSESIVRVSKAQLYAIEKVKLRPFGETRVSIKLDGTFDLTRLKSLGI